MRKLGCRLAIVILAILGFLAVGQISHSHWTGEQACPLIGPVPACYVIFVGYGLIVLSMLPRLWRPLLVFLVGWVPVITLALLGVVGELAGFAHCPQTESGIPKCYLSAILAMIIGVLAWFVFRSRTSSSRIQDSGSRT